MKKRYSYEDDTRLFVRLHGRTMRPPGKFADGLAGTLIWEAIWLAVLVGFCFWLASVV